LDDNFAQSRPDAQENFATPVADGGKPSCSAGWPLRETPKNQLDDLSSTQTEKQPDSNTEE
jgi:hypothetical protein